MSDVVALIDESSPVAGGGNHFVLVTAVVVEGPDLSADLASFFDSTPDRKKPFHWLGEGPQARERMIDLIGHHGVVAHCRVRAVGRKGQISARGQLLAQLADDVVSDGLAWCSLRAATM